MRPRPRPFSPGIVLPCTFVATTYSSRVPKSALQHPPRDHLALAAVVDVGGVEEADAAVDRAPDDRLGFLLAERPAPLLAGAEAHHPEADDATRASPCGRGSRNARRDTRRSACLDRRVDLRDTPDEAAFREKLRAWLRDNLPAEQRPRVEPQGLRRRLRGADVARGVRRPRRAVQPPGDRARGVRAPRGAAHMNVIALGMAGPTIMAHGTRGAEAALPAEDAHGRGDLVPGLLRAGRGLRPRGGAHAHRGQGRPLPRQRPEGLVVGRAPRELLHPRRARRSGGAAATRG